MTPRRIHQWAAGVIVAFGAFLATFALRSFFFQDEWFYLADLRGRGLSWDYLTGDVSGAFEPGFKALFGPILWTGAHYPPVAVFVVLMGTLAAWQLWRILVLVAGATGRTLAILALCCGCAIWIPSVIWPADGLHTLPAICFMLACVELQWRAWDRGGSLTLSLLATAALVGALLFWSKAVLIPVDLVLLRAVTTGSWRAPLRDRRALVLLFGAVVAYLVVLKAGHYGRGAGQPPIQGGRVAKITLVSWFSGFWPGLQSLGAVQPRLGLPTLEPSLDPASAWSTLLAQLLLAALVAWSVWRVRRSAWAWLWVGFVVVTSALLVALGRDYFDSSVGREYRYYADLVPLVGIGLAAAVRDVPLPRVGARAVLGASAALLLVHTGLAVAAAQRTLDRFPEEAGRRYVARVRPQLASHTFFDGRLPELVMTVNYGVYAMRSSLFGVLDDHVRFTTGPRGALVTDRGRVVPAHQDLVIGAGVPGCLAPGQSVDVPLAGLIGPGPMLTDDRYLRLTYDHASPDAQVFAAVGPAGSETGALPGPGLLALPGGHGTAVAPMNDGLSTRQFRFDMQPSGRACIRSVYVVQPKP